MTHESGDRSWNCATFDPGCVETVALEQDRANQDCDRYPRDCVGNDDAIPEFATGQYTGVSHQRSAMLTFSRHGRLPGNVPRGGRLTNRGRLCFRSRSCDHVPVRGLFASHAGPSSIISFEQRRSGDLLPLHDDRCLG
jgi:hypothetical protein